MVGKQLDTLRGERREVRKLTPLTFKAALFQSCARFWTEVGLRERQNGPWERIFNQDSYGVGHSDTRSNMPDSSGVGWHFHVRYVNLSNLTFQI